MLEFTTRGVDKIYTIEIRTDNITMFGLLRNVCHAIYVAAQEGMK